MIFVTCTPGSRDSYSPRRVRPDRHQGSEAPVGEARGGPPGAVLLVRDVDDRGDRRTQGRPRRGGVNPGMVPDHDRARVEPPRKRRVRRMAAQRGKLPRERLGESHSTTSIPPGGTSRRADCRGGSPPHFRGAPLRAPASASRSAARRRGSRRGRAARRRRSARHGSAVVAGDREQHRGRGVGDREADEQDARRGPVALAGAAGGDRDQGAVQREQGEEVARLLVARAPPIRAM